MRLAVGPGTAGIARATVRDELPTVLPSVVSDAQLLTSELVTNAMRHAGLTSSDSVGLRVELTPEVVHVAVLDDGPGFQKGRAPHDAAGGWGLYLVDSISDRWGVNTTPRTEVWFEIDL